MTHPSAAIMLRRYGDADALTFERISVGEPGSHEMRVRQTAIGVNFHDIYVRSGLYKTLTPPGIPGVEAAGVVEAVGAAVADFKPGDRIAYVSASYGAYAERRLLDARLAIKLPDAVSDKAAAAALVKGLTACMLLMRAPRPAQAGEFCLIHAAAGGVGRILCQWAKHLGVRVIGAVGSDEKAAIALDNGCEHAIVYAREDFVARVLEITEGRGVDVVYDSVGADTFEGSLTALARRGHLVNFGQSSGPVPPFAISRLAEKSNSITRPILFHYISERPEYVEMAHALFAAFQGASIRVGEATEYPLENAGDAHRALESRKTSGSVILVP